MALDESILKLETNAVAFNGIMDGDVGDTFVSSEGNVYKSLSGLYNDIMITAQSLANLMVCDLDVITGETELDIETYRVFKGILGEEVSFTFTGDIAADVLVEIKITLQQDEIGQRSFAFPASVYWENGVEPSVTMDPGTQYLVTLVSTDQGTTFLGRLSWF